MPTFELCIAMYPLHGLTYLYACMPACHVYFSGGIGGGKVAVVSLATLQKLSADVSGDVSGDVSATHMHVISLVAYPQGMPAALAALLVDGLCKLVGYYHYLYFHLFVPPSLSSQTPPTPLIHTRALSL